MIRTDALSYCGPPKLENIAEAVHQVQRGKVPGVYLEAGVALGGQPFCWRKLSRQEWHYAFLMCLP